MQFSTGEVSSVRGQLLDVSFTWPVNLSVLLCLHVVYNSLFVCDIVSECI